MVIDDFDFARSRIALGPLEADSPLIVDANAPLTLACALERLQAVAEMSQVVQAGGRVEPGQAFAKRCG